MKLSEAKKITNQMLIQLQKYRSTTMESMGESFSEDFAAMITPWAFGPKGLGMIDVLANKCDNITPMDFNNLCFIFTRWLQAVVFPPVPEPDYAMIAWEPEE